MVMVRELFRALGMSHSRTGVPGSTVDDDLGFMPLARQ